ncbi:hypothetical protein PVAP13_9KG169039 [Panicum virgatum]|uniref:Uncharacterized protein n=1 Tax=Panicum virgatum TaxID=38727 RepID=A0A8T0NPT4_PANVG|nr:hypothetical protein PVAP13_9KG169039 [Panicum virgatum]
MLPADLQRPISYLTVTLASLLMHVTLGIQLMSQAQVNKAECLQSSREKIHLSKNPRMTHPQIVYLFLNRAGRGRPGRRRFGGLAQQELCRSGGHRGAMN